MNRCIESLKHLIVKLSRPVQRVFMQERVCPTKYGNPPVDLLPLTNEPFGSKVYEDPFVFLVTLDHIQSAAFIPFSWIHMLPPMDHLFLKFVKLWLYFAKKI